MLTFFHLAETMLLTDGIARSARRNAQGHLETDASEETVQASLGFDKYENAPKAEDRKKVST